MNYYPIIAKNQIVNKITGKTLHSQQTVKYKGQTIDENRKKKMKIINIYDFGSIFNIIINAIIIFSNFIKTKFTHLIPIIALTENLEKTWKNILSTYFKKRCR